MFRGFYTLTSNMLSESRRLDVTANNIANVSTAGFKADELVTTNFGEEMVAIMSNNRLDAIEEIGSFGSIIVPGENKIDFSQGYIDETYVISDFAILGDGFFEIADAEGELVYTRNGSFSIDTLGFLNLQGAGMVQGQAGPIQVPNDRFNVDAQGNIYDEFGGFIDQIRIMDFPDYDAVIKVGEGLFQSPDDTQVTNNNNLIWKAVEGSNVDAADEMMSMMVSQRGIQSAAQVVKIYDQLSSKSNELGRV